MAPGEGDLGPKARALRPFVPQPLHRREMLSGRSRPLVAVGVPAGRRREGRREDSAAGLLVAWQGEREGASRAAGAWSSRHCSGLPPAVPGV